MSVYFAPVRRELAAKGFSKATIDALEAIATAAQSAGGSTAGSGDAAAIAALQALVAQLQTELTAAEQAAADSALLLGSPSLSPGDVLQVVEQAGVTPGGSAGQIQFNSAGQFGGFTASGDATIDTSTGAVTLTASGVSAGTYGDSGHVARVTLDAKGRVTAATNVALTAGSTGIYEAAGTGVPRASTFSWTNQGDATLADGVGSLILTAPANVNGNIRIIYRSAPTPPYSIYARFFPEAVAATTVQAGLILGNSATGRLLFLSFYSPNGTALLNRAWQRWASATSFNATIQSFPQWIFTPWMRMDVTSTTATPYFSPNGWDWSPAGGAETLSTYITAAGGSVDQIGFGAQVQNGAGAYYISAFQTSAPT